MSDEKVEHERQRVQARRLALGYEEMLRREVLYHQAQDLCYALVTRPDRGNPRIETLLNRAEERRERRARFAWGE
jgi:hypothetical protein